MNVKGFITSNIKQAERFASKNSPAILTGIGVVGVVATAYLTHKAAISSRDHVPFVRTEDGGRKEIDFSTRERFDLTWKLYIPPVLTGALSIAAILCANRVSTRRTAALAAAVTLSERAYDEYRDKVNEVVGEKKAKKIKDAISQDRVTQNPPKGPIILNEGKVLCLDEYSGRYFGSDMETLRRAENLVNKKLFSDDLVSLTTFYGFIGLKPTSISDDVGWIQPNLLELHIASALTPEDVPGVVPNMPVISFSYQTVPLKDPWRFRS